MLVRLTREQRREYLKETSSIWDKFIPQAVKKDLSKLSNLLGRKEKAQIYLLYRAQLRVREKIKLHALYQELQVNAPAQSTVYQCWLNMFELLIDDMVW